MACFSSVKRVNVLRVVVRSSDSYIGLHLKLHNSQMA